MFLNVAAESSGFLTPSPWSCREGSPASSCFFASAGRTLETQKKEPRAIQGGHLEDRPALDGGEESRGDPGEAQACEMKRAENGSRRNIIIARHPESAASPLGDDTHDGEENLGGQDEPRGVDTVPERKSDAQLETGGRGRMAADGGGRGADPLELSLDLSDCNDEVKRRRGATVVAC